MGRASETELQLIDYRVRGLTSGLAGEGEVTVEVDEHGAKHWGRAVGSDTLRASAHAFLDAINRAVSTREERRELVDVFGH